MDKGNRKAGYAIAIVEGIVEVKALPLGTSAQKAELIALTRALELSHEKRVNVYRLKVSFPNFATTRFNLEGERTINLQ